MTKVTGKPHSTTYPEAMDELTKQHSARIEEMQRAMQQQIQESEARVAKLLEKSTIVAEKQVAEEEKSPAPQAMWTVIDGEKLLVLNEVAAAQQQTMLDTLSEVLEELKTVIQP